MTPAKRLAEIRRIIERWRARQPGLGSLMSKEERRIYRLTKPQKRKQR